MRFVARTRRVLWVTARLPGAGVSEPVKVGVLAQRDEMQCKPDSQ